MKELFKVAATCVRRDKNISQLPVIKYRCLPTRHGIKKPALEGPALDDSLLMSGQGVSPVTIIGMVVSWLFGVKTLIFTYPDGYCEMLPKEGAAQEEPPVTVSITGVPPKALVFATGLPPSMLVVAAVLPSKLFVK